MHSLPQRLLAEAVGTAFLLMAVIGSGIAAQRLSPADVGLQLFENAVATAFALTALIWAFGPISGAHFNPAVTWAEVAQKGRSSTEGLAYTAAQIAGGIAGAIIANLMFGLPPAQGSQKERAAPELWLSEIIATTGLLLVIFLIARTRRSLVAPAVGAYIGAAYFFTASTSFANPAVTIARMFSDTFAGIHPGSAPMFILMQLIGAAIAVAVILLLRRRPAP